MNPDPNTNLIDFGGAPPAHGPAPAPPPQALPQAQAPNPQPTQPPPHPPADPMTVLLHSIYQMGLESSALRENQRLQGLAFEAMTAQIRAMSSAPRTSSNVKVRDPPLFKGKAAELDSFIHDVDSAIYLQPALLNGSNQAKCIYMASWLDEGAPKTWLKAMLRRNPNFYDDWNAFRAAFRLRFQDSDLEARKLHKLERLTQTGSAASYANEFVEGLEYVDWTEKHAIRQFNRGLKHDLQVQLLKEAEPGTLDEWIPLVVQMDNKMHNLEVETRRRDKFKSSVSVSRPSEKSHKPRAANSGSNNPPPPPPGPSHSGEVPMEIDGVKHGKVTEAERERRRKDKLCFYCGKGKHMIAECPNMSDEKKKKYLASQASRSSGKA